MRPQSKARHMASQQRSAGTFEQRTSISSGLSSPTNVRLLFVVLVVLFTGLLAYPFGHARKSTTQDSEKLLEIERYANEPLELLDLKIGDKSVKNRIVVKGRKDGEGLDYVRFHETDGWFRRIRVKLRNTSGKPIVGLRPYLYFEPPATRTLFRVQLTNSKELQSEPFEPGAEIDLAVGDQSWNQTQSILNQHSADPNLAVVTFSMDIVAFSDGSQWNRGHLVRRDPDNPIRWIPLNK